uniref:Ribosomal RNA-processing protein 12-like conserved domain-containing protein n=1 Tax=Plectus sambesii TaxID=2011161 RepID=A0A914WPA7_9BILA
MGAKKYRHRVGTVGKGKNRLMKGHSSDSNPTSKKHRAAARASRLFAQAVPVDEQPISNGIDAVVAQLPMESISLGDGERSMISEGGLSRFSQFTSCTNPTFDAVHRIWKSGSTMQGDVLAVLAAVAEIIRENGGTETDTEYFASLLTALAGTPAEDSNRLAATAYLLNLITKKVSKEVLRKEFSRASEVLYAKLAEQASSEHAPILKNLLGALGAVLRSQPTIVWTHSSCRAILTSVATFSTHDKPWVRTMSRRVVRAVITDPVSSLDNGVHPAAASVGQFCIQQLEQCAGPGAGITATRVLCLLEGIMHKMPGATFKTVAETIFRSLTLSDGKVKCAALQALYRSLQRQPGDASLPIETNAQLILALRDFQPLPNDVAVCAYWMQALCEAHVCLTAKDRHKSSELLPRSFELIVSHYDHGHEPLAEVTSTAVARLVERCLEGDDHLSDLCVRQLERALNLQSAPVWRHVLKSLSKVFEELKELCADLPATRKTLTTLAELRESDECFCKGEVELTIGAAIRHIGAGPVLAVVGLDLDPALPNLPVDVRRSWLLPVLRASVSRAPLALFVRYFLPLAIKLHRRLPNLDAVSAKVYETVQRQLWDLLPAFCAAPTDLEESFPDLAQVLGAALTERPDLRLTVLAGLRGLVRFAQAPDAPESRQQAVAKYAKNYLPILFSLYTADPPAVPSGYDTKGVRLAVLETIRLYVEIAPQELVVVYVDKAIEKSADAGEELEKKVRILDVLAALTKRANGALLTTIFDAVFQWFESPDAALQKKAFRILEEMFRRRGSPDTESFFVSHWDHIQNALVHSMAGVAASSRAARLGVCRQIVAGMDDYTHLTEFSTTIADQLVRSLDKAQSTHTRSNAAKCLMEMCNKLIAVGNHLYSPSTVLRPVFDAIYALATPKAAAGSNGDIDLETSRATLVALNILAQKYAKVVDAATVTRLMAHGCAWIGDGRPAVRLLVIRLLKVLVTKLPDYALNQYREPLLAAVFGQMAPDVTQKMKRANRLLLDALAERFGAQVLAKYTDKSDWLKQLKNIEKIRRRKQRGEQKKAEGEEGSDDEDDDRRSTRTAKTTGADTILELLEDSDDDADSGADSDEDDRRSRKSHRSNSVWLKEGDEDDLIDLLDRTAMAKKVTTAQPSRPHANKPKTESNAAFKTAKDGRLIIEDLDEKAGSKRKRRDDSVMDVAESSSKKRRAENDDDEDDEGSGDELNEKRSTVASSWVPGGKGIHRDTTKDNERAAAASQQRPKKTKGDVSKKGQTLQPYAYLPLRKRKGQATEMKKLINGARKGANKGSKGRGKQQQRNPTVNI